MRVVALILLALLLPVPVFATGPTTITHKTYRGGTLHEAQTDGVRDGIVIWKNGTAQETHNGKLGKWLKNKGTQEGPPHEVADASGRMRGHGEQREIPNYPFALAASRAPYMAYAMLGMLSPVTDPVIVDNYVLVSPQLVTYWGGMTSTTNKVHLAEDSMNEAFLHSGVNTQQRVVGISQDDQAEKSTVDANLTDLFTRSQAGHFASIRAATGYDNLTLMVHVGDLAGSGYLMAASYAMNVVSGDYATGNMTYAHENGHNFGLCHNYGDANCSQASACYPTGCGYGETRFRTVMSYPGGARTRQWSAPPPAKWYVDGVSAVGVTGQTDAAGCLTKTTPLVAAYHATVIPVLPATHTDPTNIIWIATPSNSTSPTGIVWQPLNNHNAPTGVAWTTP